MTAERYTRYLILQAALSDHEGLTDEEHERFRQLGEDLLLSRPREAERAEEQRQAAALLLSIIVGEERLDDVAADLLWLDIAACGPEFDQAPAPQPV